VFCLDGVPGGGEMWWLITGAGSSKDGIDASTSDVVVGAAFAEAG